MSDLFNRITENQDVIRKLLSKIPGLMDISNGRIAEHQINF